MAIAVYVFVFFIAFDNRLWVNVVAASFAYWAILALVATFPAD